MITSAELRARARASLAGNWATAVGTMLLFAVATAILAWIGKIKVIGWIIELVAGGILGYGLYNWFLTLARGTVPAVTDLIKVIEDYVKVIILHVLIVVFVSLWSLLLLVPGIIAALRYSQAYYILRDNPEIRPLEAINRSKAMMVGHKGRLFVLGLTFLGWIILGALPLGIGLLWVIPYLYTAQAHFHIDLLQRSAQLPPPPPQGEIRAAI